MTDAITTTVTWQDLIDAQREEYDDLADAYAEIADLAREEHGEGALQRPTPGDDLATLQQQAQLIDQEGRQIEQRIHALEQLRDELGDGAFEIKMLSGREVMDTEVSLRGDSDGEEGITQMRRNARTIDAATVDAPEGVPRDDAGSPTPSDCPQQLVNALYEQVQRFNTAGDTGFRGEGFGSDAASPMRSGSSVAPTPASATSSSSGSSDADSPASGSDG